jgi:hypothetical protein
VTANDSRTGPALRARLAGISALLVVSLFLGASLNAAKPAVREAARDSAAERMAVRELTVSLARAVRHLVGSDQHKPCLNAVPGRPISIAIRAARPVCDERRSPPVVMLLRTGLLDLPPPAWSIA